MSGHRAGSTRPSRGALATPGARPHERSVSEKRAGEDVVMVGPALPSGGHAVLRKRGEVSKEPRWELGAMRPMEEGKPLHGELVKLAAREEPDLYDVEVLHDARAPRTGTDDVVQADASGDRKGPAQVATDDYRRGWSRLFGKRALPS